MKHSNVRALAAAITLALPYAMAQAQQAPPVTPVAAPAASAPADATFATPTGVSLSALLKDAGGKVLPNIVVRMIGGGGSTIGTATSDAHGLLIFPPVAPGTYTLASDAITLDPASRTAVVTATAAAPLNLVAADVSTLGSVQVVAQRLNEARQSLSPDLGADSFQFSRQDIQNLPAGDSTPLNDVLLQAPGVVQDSYGQLHVRGDHADLQYRINDIIIPESIGGFGQALQTRFADSISLITGALPAQYGYRTAGVVDIQTKGGAFDKGGMIGYAAGSHDSSNVYGDLGGTQGDFTYYVTGSYLRNDLGIEAPTANGNPLHDQTTQANGFGYFSYHLSGDARLSLIAGAVNNEFQIPNVPGISPQFELAGTPPIPSADLNQNQTEKTNYTALALQGSYGDNTDYQVALFHRYTSVQYNPDEVGDLIYTGVAGNIFRQNEAWGLQGDAAYHLDKQNTLRTGVYFSDERLVTDNTSQVFPADAQGNQTSTTPFTIVDNTSGTSRLFGLYLQDEWRPVRELTINYGIRYDRWNSFVSENQWSPRVGAVWELSADTTLHAGYARYFTPPPSELVTDSTIAKYEGTTNQAPNMLNSPVQAERSNYYDIGINQKVTPAFTLGLDGYYRQVTNLLDEGQFGTAILYTPFNYAEGRVYGVELAGSYHDGNFGAYANFAYSKAQGKDIVSSQYTFDPDELAYIHDHWIYLDHNQTYSASAGASYLWQQATFSVSAIYGSGLRAGFANLDSLPSYVQVDAGVSRPFDLPGIGKINARLTIVNLFNKVYEIRDGTGVGVGAPQYGPLRAFYVALEKPFSF
jgi:outer membrane receptor protein involved in Fe transport